MAAPIAAVRDGHAVNLSDYTCREGSGRYFKNKPGGLGQYYLGVFRELKIMEGDSDSVIRGFKSSHPSQFYF